MRPIFIVELNNGKTDNIFEYNFKDGVFSGNEKYSYSDIKNFIGIPCEILSSMFFKEDKKKKVEEATEA